MRRLGLADAIEHMAAALAFARPERKAPRLDLMQWDGVQPYTELYSLVIASRQDEHRGAILTDVKPQDLERPIRYAMLSDVSEDGTLSTWDGYVGTFMRQASARDLRGVRVPFPTLYHCFYGVLLVTCEGGYNGSICMVSWHPRERQWIAWHQQNSALWRGKEAAEVHWRAQYLIGAQFSARYDWHALVGFKGAPRVSLPCSPEEARQLFKARDLPPGRERRAALRHWVTRHAREKESDAPVRVREHLRGATEFHMDQIECMLIPSAYDRERALEAKHDG
jgi:hypothetical protein